MFFNNIIILNLLNKITNYINFKIVRNQLKNNSKILLKNNFYFF